MESIHYITQARLAQPVEGRLGDPADWVRVEWDKAWPTRCLPSCFENVEYVEGEDASLGAR